MTISILSDTHGYLDQQIITHLASSDEIWHAGDIGDSEIIDRLENLPGVLRAVYGNIDGGAIRNRIPEYASFEINGLKVLILHIANKPPKYNSLTRHLISEHGPDILVCGHSHILRVENDKENKLLFINPGACGQHGFHKVRTIIQFEISAGKPTKMRVIKLGQRGKIKA